MMTPRQALAFVRHHGVVLESARGLEPSLAARIAGEPIKGSWWGHPRSHEIYACMDKLRDSKAILTCTLAKRMTYVHRRLWPAFVRLADRFPTGALDRVVEVHTPSGRHQRQDVAFPTWVAADVLAQAAALSKVAATEQIGVWLERYGVR
jgi:hypothetical protein